MLYLTGAHNQLTLGGAQRGIVGIMLQPNSHYERFAPLYPKWAADTGCFAHPEQHNDTAYLRWLSTIPAPERCLFATAPDRFDDGVATLRVAVPMLAHIRACNLPAALVAQTGMRAEQLPWDAFDVLFVGGPNRWQESVNLRHIVTIAHRRRIPVHVGRVNTRKRLQFSATRLRAASCDGTYVRYGPSQNWPKLERWLHEIAAQ